MIYVIKCEGTGLRKLGMTNNPRERVRGLQLGSAAKLTLELVAEGGRAEELRMHETFADRRMHNEWFAVSREEVLALPWAAFAEAGPAPAKVDPEPLAPPRVMTAQDRARADAVRAELAKSGPRALAGLAELTKSSDPEVAQDAKAGLEAYQLRQIDAGLRQIERFLAQRTAAHGQ